MQARHEERTSYYEVATMLIDGHRQIENDLYVRGVGARFLTSFSRIPRSSRDARTDYLALSIVSCGDTIGDKFRDSGVISIWLRVSVDNHIVRIETSLFGSARDSN